MKHICIILIGIISIVSCKNKPTPSKGAGENQADTTSSYMPINDFISEDIKQIDSFAGGILLKTSGTVKKDSAFIQPEKFKQLAAMFSSPELDSTIFNNQFSETSLMDESTNMLNFIYTAKNDQSQIRKAIVYVSPGVSTDKVNRIYLEKELKSGDTIISQKLTWKLRQYLIIAEIRQTTGGYESTSIRKAIWDAQLYAD